MSRTSPDPAPGSENADQTPSASPAPERSLLKRPEFIDRVVERSGGKKKDVRPAVEAALAILGEAIAAGEEINLPPLGKIRVTRKKTGPHADVFACRLRRPHQMAGASHAEGEKTGPAPLATDGEAV